MYRRIRDLREDSDLNQTEVASYYEAGGHDIPTETLIKLADFYGVSVDYLLGRTNVKEMNR